LTPFRIPVPNGVSIVIYPDAAEAKSSGTASSSSRRLSKLHLGGSGDGDADQPRRVA
jgi:hypothetical protein